MIIIKSFENIVMNCFGDSTTWGDNGIETGGNEISWTTQIEKFLKFKTIRNYGAKGSRIAITSDRNDSFVERYKDMENSADIITILGGVNDFQHDVPLGKTDSFDPHYFYGALNTIISGLLEKYPDKQIIFMTPMKNNLKNPTKNYPDSFSFNKLNLKQIDYVNAIKETCDYYSIEVLDLYKESGISPYSEFQTKLYMPDKLHYNKEGYFRLAKKIAEYLNQHHSLT
ncbi:SGNH/GDSL hydrolase family protein [Clostridium estertheticum]|uniref:SGNH/GDSL hydrolase family protein n=1 Tax=Clostridium estertheticum TaxID=238834 RepID=UPI001CF5C3B0|nr:SGNH/GDSL hydrolase family protein [Clostridium estertheticum]MCB2306032.1 SGNH/GDSL hydrolase family protein [Clostridium estertheticum]MCB2346555.1 SGNH/GDSL hydrolase family protein [Clostridium estertheticum]MCB2348997.1 SGNH/GDSL hydrolase family protein [Clostridium estertheticum]WAG47638.1 SGNH/GDSL hydrolase family protein [Clostridium estertheticum]